MKKNIGFTLIELLIVMVIISIVAGVAVITVTSSSHKQYETFTNQFVNTFMLAEQEAMLQPAVLGLAVTAHAILFYQLQENEKTHKTAWELIREGTLSPHPIPKNMQIIVKINNQTVATDGQSKIIISPSNDLTPFVMLIGKPDETPYYQITGKANGEVSSDVYAAE